MQDVFYFDLNWRRFFAYLSDFLPVLGVLLLSSSRTFA